MYFKHSLSTLERIVNKNQIIDLPIRNEFLGLFKEVKINKGEYFIKSGQYTSKIGFIIEGVFRVYYTDTNGNDINNVFLLQNDFIIGRLRPMTKILTNIQAITNSVLLVADVKEVFNLAEKHHSISQLILKTASYYFDKNVDREIKVRSQNATKNYKCFLKEYPNLINEIPHYYIADYLQISSTHLSRIRKELISN